MYVNKVAGHMLGFDSRRDVSFFATTRSLGPAYPMRTEAKATGTRSSVQAVLM